MLHCGVAARHQRFHMCGLPRRGGSRGSGPKLGSLGASTRGWRFRTITRADARGGRLTGLEARGRPGFGWPGTDGPQGRSRGQVRRRHGGPETEGFQRCNGGRDARGRIDLARQREWCLMSRVQLKRPTSPLRRRWA